VLRYGLLHRHNIGTNRWSVVCSSLVTSGWDLDLRSMEWLVNCDIESDIAFLRRCPVAPDQQDKRWREQSLRGKLTFQSARATRRATARTGWLVDIARIRVLEHGVCREFTPVFAKHLRSFWLVDSLAMLRLVATGSSSNSLLIIFHNAPDRTVSPSRAAL
jgi:hypothetical protein